MKTHQLNTTVDGRTLTQFIASLVLTATPAWADVTLPSVFGSHMVMQRDAELPVWGWADPGEAVTVQIVGQSAKAKADGMLFADVDTDRVDSYRWRGRILLVRGREGAAERLAQGCPVYALGGGLDEHRRRDRRAAVDPG